MDEGGAPGAAGHLDGRHAGLCPGPCAITGVHQLFQIEAHPARRVASISRVSTGAGLASGRSRVSRPATNRGAEPLSAPTPPSGPHK